MHYKKKKALIMALVLIMFSVVFTKFLAGTSASAGADHFSAYNKYYKSYVVRSGDSLWSIAEEHLSGGHITVADYIQDVMASNHLKSDYIYDGQLIILPYYETEAVMCAVE